MSIHDTLSGDESFDSLYFIDNMAALIGALQPYDPATDWKLYELSVTNFFAANGITAPADARSTDRRKAALLATIGMRALEIIRSLCAPDDPSTKSYDEIIELLRRHYTKAPTKSLARQKLASAKQKEEESVDEFVARLRYLAIDCQYGAAMLPEVLRVQFINGIQAESLKKKLLAAEDETLEQLLTRGRSFEQVERDVRAFRQADKQELGRSSETHFVKKSNSTMSEVSTFGQRSHPESTYKFNGSQIVGSRPSSSRVGCHRCGGSNHDSSACWYTDKTCNNCGKVGHKAKVCHSASKGRPTRPQQNARAQPRQSATLSTPA